MTSVPTTKVAAAKSQLVALAGAGLDLDSYMHEACDVIRGAVPFDFACLATTDPASGLITGAMKTDPGDSRDEDFARFEFELDDVNQFLEISRRSIPVGVLEADTGGRPEVSSRYRDFLIPQFSFGHEIRAAFVANRAVWGLIGVYRPAGARGFSADESDFVGQVTGSIAVGLRNGMVASVAESLASAVGPAMLVVDVDGEVHLSTPAAEQRIAELGGTRWGALPMPLLSVLGAARQGTGGRSAVAPRARVRTPSGQWLVVHAAPLAARAGRQGDVALTIEEARPPDVIPLIVSAFGLTGRESEVAQLVLAGCDTNGIARRLSLSPWTVQDHLKSVFTKARVGNRRELSARIFYDHYAARLGTPLGSDGWFATAPDVSDLQQTPRIPQ